MWSPSRSPRPHPSSGASREHGFAGTQLIHSTKEHVTAVGALVWGGLIGLKFLHLLRAAFQHGPLHLLHHTPEQPVTSSAVWQLSGSFWVSQCKCLLRHRGALGWHANPAPSTPCTDLGGSGALGDIGFPPHRQGCLPSWAESSSSHDPSREGPVARPRLWHELLMEGLPCPSAQGAWPGRRAPCPRGLLIHSASAAHWGATAHLPGWALYELWPADG